MITDMSKRYACIHIYEDNVDKFYSIFKIIKYDNKWKICTSDNPFICSFSTDSYIYRNSFEIDDETTHENITKKYPERFL